MYYYKGEDQLILSKVHKINIVFLIGVGYNYWKLFYYKVIHI